MSEVLFNDVTKSFGRFQAVKRVTLRFAAQRTTCLLGPSGCGKTTILRMIAGLEQPTSGTIQLGKTDITRLPARQRDLAMVFQYPVIYRGLGVFENVELPLRQVGLSASERKQRAEEAIELLGLTSALNADPDQFDNGTRQRVAFARAIARRTPVILFDEPITNVDPDAKFQLKQDLKKLTERTRQTIIYVTHDQNEAMTLADEIVLLKDGEVLQQGPPRSIYNHPSHQFGGWFLGNPGMSFLRYEMPADPTGGFRTDLFPFKIRLSQASQGKVSGTRLILGLRPEYVRVHREAHPDAIEGRVIRKFRGVAGQYLVAVQLAQHIVYAKVAGRLGGSLGQSVWVSCALDSVTLFSESERAIAATLERIF